MMLALAVMESNFHQHHDLCPASHFCVSRGAACDEHHNAFKPAAKNDGFRTMALRDATGARLFT